MNSTLCCNSKPNPPLSFFLSFFLSFSLSPPPLSTHTHTHTQTLLPLSLPLSSRPLGLWSSGVLWVGGLVGGRWGCWAERAGIQSNMHGEITIAPLGDLQMLAVQGIVVGSYRYSNISWETAKQHIRPCRSAFTLFLSAAFSFPLHLPSTFLSLSGKFEPPLLTCVMGALKKTSFQTEKKPFLVTGCL